MLTRSSESQLLLACARTGSEPQHLQALLRPGLDWRYIVERAESYGITPLVHSRLKQIRDERGQIPQVVMEHLKHRTMQHAFHTMNLYRKLQNILAAFARANIPVITLKGAALAALVYDDPSLRPMGDLDLLVRASEIDAADAILRTLQYAPTASYQAQAWYRECHHHLAPYVSHDHSLVVELHHHIHPPTLGIHVPIQTLWQRAESVSIASAPTYVLAPMDLLLHLSVHIIGGICLSGEGQLRSLCDIAAVICKYKARIDWEQLFQTAWACNAARHVYYALWLAQDLVGAEVSLHNFQMVRGNRLFKAKLLHGVLRQAVLGHRRENPPIPSWVYGDLCFELLNASAARRKRGSFWQNLWERFLFSARQKAACLPHLTLLYTLFVHPIYLLLRTVGRIAR